MSRELNAIITGASSGIGKAIALAIASVGGSLCLIGRDKKRLEQVAQASRAAARRTLVFPADLSADHAVEDLARYVKQNFNSADTLVHCAGAHTVGSFEKISVDVLDRLYRLNLRMPYALTQALLPLLKSQKGQIVFVNSSQGLQARAKASAFASTQHALKAVADGLRQEINAEGIRVLSVFPGRTATPRTKALFENEGQAYRPELLLQPEDVAQIILNALQLPRTAEVTNIEVRPLAKSY
ncbi:MAG: SDR family NAD(P)-dependent oxidoreductase [Methylocapsa sp.]|nr:SDR family NAD(P)-dependent oxidoreductase [Methylocapsa sp.]